MCISWLRRGRVDTLMCGFSIREPLMAIFSMCGGILLLAAMNLASLIMARAAARERELATRLALGATRRRLLQQLLVESLLIAVLGSMSGLALAPLVSRSLAKMLMSGQPSSLYLDTTLDLRVLGFAACTACFTALLIGLLPALQATSGSLNKHIKEGQHAVRSHERKRVFPRVLLASEVALALLLVVGAGLLATSMVRLYKSEIGFEPKGIVNVALNMNKQPLDGEALTGLYRQIGEELSTLPGVRGVSFERIVPLSSATWTETFSSGGGQAHGLDMNEIGPDYFRTMRIPIAGGRDFRWTDSNSESSKIILNRAAAKLLFGASNNAIGQTVVEGDGGKRYEVLAVVGDAKYESLRKAAPATGYWPITQTNQHKPSYSAVVRVDHFTIPFALAVRSITGKLAPEIPSPELTSMERVLDDSISSERVMAMLSVFFAFCALLVTGVGLYGTLSYNTARRTSEIGIRMALGAQRTGVVVLVFRENLIVAISGCGAGVISAVLASRVLTSFLYETSPRDPWILLGSITALALIAGGASLLPAIRAASIEPITAIRCE